MTKKMRTKILIYPKFQLKLIIYNAIIIAFSFILVGLSIYFSFDQLRQTGLNIPLPSDHAYFRFLDLEEQTFFYYLIGSFLLAIVFTTMFTLYISQKLAGPICRLKSYFDNLAKTGKLSNRDISFRKGDFFRELPEKINASLKKISKK